MPNYKSFCWKLGNTSFRTKNFNRKIEELLIYLQGFWNNHPNEAWSNNNDLQTEFYNLLQSNGFVEGNAGRPDKDAREKLSGLESLGLIDSDHHLTAVGYIMYDIATTKDYKEQNILQLPKDSFLYLQQLLTAHIVVNGDSVRPLVVLLMLLNEFEYLTKDEFTYLLPLIKSQADYNTIQASIHQIRENRASIDDVLHSFLMNMPNYQAALQEFIDASEVTLPLILKIGMNRKSGTNGMAQYDKPYFELYKAIKALDRNSVQSILRLLGCCNKINGKAATYWRKLLFKTTTVGAIRRTRQNALQDITLLNAQTETERRTEFFKHMRLGKDKATLSDYCDLNRRYMSITDIIEFADDKVELVILAKAYFHLCSDQFAQIAFTPSNILAQPKDMATILSVNITEPDLFGVLRDKYGINVSNTNEVEQYVKDEKLQRFNALIAQKFSKEQLLDILKDFEDRHDSNLQKAISSNADAPTMFEYIVGIIWWLISEKQGNILDYMNLSLDADLLPKSHAGGGEEDITYRYEAYKDYPKHTLLIELTLADGTNQRRMEMEPVSRHLGDYRLEHTEEAYTTFVSTYLDKNVISDFRGRKYHTHYSRTDEQSVTGLKIIPLNTVDLKYILTHDITYNDLYKRFDTAYKDNSGIDPLTWYRTLVKY